MEKTHRHDTRVGHRRRIPAAMAAATALALGGLHAAPVSAGPQDPFAKESARLSSGLAGAVTTAGFDSLVDFSTNNGRGAAKPAQFLPNVDVAVIEMSGNGSITGVANVLYDRDSPKGYQVEVDRQTLATRGVEFSRWRLERWDDQSAWAAGPAAADITVPAESPKKRYMAAYPASVLKVMVAHSIYRLVDSKRLTLATPVRYHEEVVDGVTQTCGYGPSNPTDDHRLRQLRDLRPAPGDQRPGGARGVEPALR
jgi:hypothetical protein